MKRNTLIVVLILLIHVQADTIEPKAEFIPQVARKGVGLAQQDVLGAARNIVAESWDRGRRTARAEWLIEIAIFKAVAEGEFRRF